MKQSKSKRIDSNWLIYKKFIEKRASALLLWPFHNIQFTCHIRIESSKQIINYDLIKYNKNKRKSKLSEFFPGDKSMTTG